MAKLKLWWSKIKDNLNFFRIHVLFVTFTPLVFSAIFYAANGENHIKYIDALFSCFSAITMCGLLTIELSAVTGFQQAILFVQAAIGNPVVVSWVMVYIRRRYFNKRLKYIVEAEIAKRKALAEQGALEEGEGDEGGGRLLRRLTRAFTIHPTAQGGDKSENANGEGGVEKRTRRPALSARKAQGDVHPETPRRIDPRFWVTESSDAAPEWPSQASTLRNDSNNSPTGRLAQTRTVGFQMPKQERVTKGRVTASLAGADGYFGLRVESPGVSSSYQPSTGIIHDDRTYIPPGGAPLRRRTTVWMQHTQRNDDDGSTTQEQATVTAKNRGYGGFPYPTTLLYRLLRKVFPSVRRSFERIATLLPWRTRTRTMMSNAHDAWSESERKEQEGRINPVKYFSDSFIALIGRNSKFYSLTEESLEELGGVEYRALNALLWILACYHFLVQLLSFTIIAPYMSIPRWAPDFAPPNLHRHVPPVWYAAFQVVSAYTTTGMSLVDQSMVPFQEAYPLIFVCLFLILAGNLAFPIFLRFFIWSIMKLMRNTRLNETLHFLLDHPRRCYIYLFPSQQTWLLLGIVLLLNCIDWLFFLILNIGESTFEAIPLGVRFAIGVLQATSVRAAGFATTSLSSLAPALQVLYVIVMYLGVYPIALSVHATNVYEEKSLGVFDEDEEDKSDEEPKVEGSEVASYGRYIVWHARRQLAFDMWWLGLALFFVCIIERSKIQNQENFEWFTVFTIIFEIISAYSVVGISLGVPYANFSFSGALTPLSKLIMIAVMLRGRHRGLPVAIDRAVMLPFEFKKAGWGAAAGEDEQGGEGDGISVINGIIGEDGNVGKMSRKEG